MNDKYERMTSTFREILYAFYEDIVNEMQEVCARVGVEVSDDDWDKVLDVLDEKVKHLIEPHPTN